MFSLVVMVTHRYQYSASHRAVDAAVCLLFEGGALTAQVARRRARLVPGWVTLPTLQAER